jgi:hypothetical protein
MAFIIADRVRESSTTTGTGSFTLAGAVVGYQTFDAVLNTADTTYYTIADQGGGPNWEVGIGTFTAPSTLARTTILSSSNGGSIVTFGAGTKDVFISLPASRTNVEDQPNVIEVNSSSPALRINQIGAGDALLVEDSANPDATPFVIDQFGAVVVGGTSSSSTTISGSNQFAMVGTTAAGAKQGLSRWDNSTGPFSVQFAKSRSGTIGTQAAVSSGDSIAQLEFFGSDGTQFIPAASILAAVDGTPGTNDMPGRLVFATTADGASTPTERMRIDSAGDVGIGTTNPTARLNVVDATTQDAVRITQTGTGNALVVEDATNPDSSPFVVNADGFLITGAATNQVANLATGNARVQILGGTAPLALFRDADSSTAINLEFAKRRATGGLLASGDVIGRLYFSGNDGVAAIPAAFIDAAVDGTPGVNDMPGRLVFSTTADGAATPTERMRINNAGNVGIGTSTPTALLTVGGTAPRLDFAESDGSAGFNTTTLVRDADLFAIQTRNSGTFVSNDYRMTANASGALTHEWRIANTQRMLIDSAGQVQVGAGTAAAPALSTLTDTNTGMFFPAADTIAFAEGGVESMRIDASGNVGIGTTTPGAALDVSGTSFVRNTRFGNTTAFIGRRVNGTVSVPTTVLNNDNQVLRFDFYDGTTYLPGAFIEAAVDGTPGTNDMPGRLVFATTADGAASATERLRIASAGQIGIGGANYGTSGQVLTSNGAAAAPSWQSVTPNGLLLNVQVFTSSGTYTRTSGATRAVVIAVGGGGGGGGSGGTGGTGGTTSFGSQVTAVGGSGGATYGGNLVAPGGAGGTGGTGSTISIPGQGGGSGSVISAQGTGGIGGGAGGGRGTDRTAGIAGSRGGGGSGGGVDGGCATGRGAGGGGQGETAIDYITTGLGATETVTIGAAGTAGTGSTLGGAGGAGYIIVYEYS